MLLRFVVRILMVGVVMLATGRVFSEDFPTKPIRIVTTAPGGGNDLMARLIAPGITGPLAQPVTVDNRTGLVAIETTTKAAPDGYTLLILGNIVWLGPYLLQKVTYDPVRDLTPITLATMSPSVLVVHPSLPVNSVRDLIALAKARPRELNYASGGTGGAGHLAAELFKSMAKVDIVRVNYKGTGPALTALLGGEIQVNFSTATPVLPYLKSSRLKALAVTSAQPSVLVPGLPTLAASGVPGYESVNVYAIFAPGKTPAEIINRLNVEIVRFLKTADAKERLLNAGIEVVASSPEALMATIKSDMAAMGKVIKDADIRGE